MTVNYFIVITMSLRFPLIQTSIFPTEYKLKSVSESLKEVRASVSSVLSTKI